MGVSYRWQLVAQSTGKEQRFGGSYLVPIAFSDPTEKGIIATA